MGQRFLIDTNILVYYYEGLIPANTVQERKWGQARNGRDRQKILKNIENSKIYSTMYNVV